MTAIIPISLKEVWKLLETVNDPEVPVLSVIDLGIIRDVKINGDEVEVTITPTYTGCPAMDVISMSIKMELLSNGFKNVKIKAKLNDYFKGYLSDRIAITNFLEKMKWQQTNYQS